VVNHVPRELISFIGRRLREGRSSLAGCIEVTTASSHGDFAVLMNEHDAIQTISIILLFTTECSEPEQAPVSL
jgi:hypothetical protein